MLQLEVFVVEFAAPNRLAAGAITVGEVTSLDHEVGNNTVEDGTLVAIALGVSSKANKVLDSFGDRLTVHTHHNATSRLAANLFKAERMIILVNLTNWGCLKGKGVKLMVTWLKWGRTDVKEDLVSDSGSLLYINSR